MLKESELRVLKTANGNSIKEVAEALGSNSSHISKTVKSLEKKGLVETKRGKRKKVHPADNKALELYKEITEEESHIDFPELLKGKAIPILYYLNEEISVKKIAEKSDNYRNTVHRVVKTLLHRGIIKKENNSYQLKEEFQKLNEFAREYVHQQHRRKSRKNYTILWESLNEFLIQSEEKIREKNFLVTGPELFQNYDLPLFPAGKNYYFYSEKKNEIKIFDLICHTLLIDQGNRYQSYCLLLMRNENVNKDKLMKKSEKYGLKETIKSLIIYLRTKGEKRTSNQPEWEELKDLAEKYGVEL